MNKIKDYFVYRFLNKDGIIVYVGRTTDLRRRFSQHSHLTEDIKTIEYIKCRSEADMAWKEIYYINLFYNKLSTNVIDVYSKGEGTTDLKLKDKWVKYKLYPQICNANYLQIAEESKYLLHTDKKYDYKKLIHIIEHSKLNSITNDEDSYYELSQSWFIKNNKNPIMKKLSNNLCNYYRNIMPKITTVKQENMLWTSFYFCKDILKQKGYTKAFINIGEKVSNYKSKKYFGVYV